MFENFSKCINVVENKIQMQKVFKNGINSCTLLYMVQLAQIISKSVKFFKMIPIGLKMVQSFRIFLPLHSCTASCKIFHYCKFFFHVYNFPKTLLFIFFSIFLCQLLEWRVHTSLVIDEYQICTKYLVL